MAGGESVIWAQVTVKEKTRVWRARSRDLRDLVHVMEQCPNSERESITEKPSVKRKKKSEAARKKARKF